ncbi:MAG: CAP domain-containing protein [Thermoleophilia bacterium]
MPGTRTLRRAAAAGAAALAALPAAGLGATAAQAVDFLNQQRRMNGIPGVSLDDSLSQGCAAHNAYMAMHGFGHGETAGASGWTPEGAMGTPAARAAEVLYGGDTDGWDGRWSNPWMAAPLHLAGMFHPNYTRAGYARSSGFTCMRLNNPGAAPAGVYTLPGPGVTDVPTTIDASNEGPYSPGDVVGVDDRAMGFNILVWRIGGDARAARFRSVSVRTAKGPVEVKPIDTSTPLPGGGTWNWMSNMIVPTRPLAPNTTYTVDIVFADGLRHRVSFSTGTTVRIERAPVAILRAGVDRLRWGLKGRVRVRTATAVWRSPERSVRIRVRVGRRAAMVPSPAAPGLYRVKLLIQGKTLNFPGPVLVK